MKKQKIEAPVKKNERLVVDIVDMTYDGRGVAKVDGFPIFVEAGITGERVKIHVMKVMKKFAFAKIMTWETTSENRVEAVEKDLIRTGIAPLHHMSYDAQLDFKKNQVTQAMKRIGGFDELNVADVLGMEHPFAYRNKAQIPVRMIGADIELGFFRKNSHDLIVVEDFLIQDKMIDEILLFLKERLRKYSIKPYDEGQHSGHLKSIVIRKGHYSNEVMVTFVTRKKKIFYLHDIVTELVEAYPNVVSVMQNIQPNVTNKVLDERLNVLYGKDSISDELLGKTYHISAQSFYQVNAEQAENLYKKAIELADLKEDDVVLDAYCGIGTIGLSMANKVKKVYGVEIVPEAIEDAIHNAEINNITNVEFKAGSADKVLKNWTADGIKFDVIVVDPPRKGLTEDFIKQSVELQPEKIVYISCDPSTMARDMKLFAGLGYTSDTVYPVDMFPQTTHIECVTVLKRKS